MATFLVNAKMSPELAARVDASVHGRRGASGRAVKSARVTALVRLVLFVGIAAAIGSFASWRRGEGRRIDGDRAALLESLHARGAAIGEREKGAPARVEPWLVALSGPYEGDALAPELRAPGALDARLARPTVYVHGPTGAFHGPTGIAGAAAASVKDTFVSCLLAPPASKSERAMLESVRAVYSGGASFEERTANVARLADGQAALRVLTPAFEARIKDADDDVALAKVKGELDRAPLEKAKLALSAELLVAVMDEPGTGAGPSELDGERPHDVRVALVDLAAGKVLLRARRRVDPGGWSEKSRAQYSVDLDECGRALDVRAIPSAP